MSMRWQLYDPDFYIDVIGCQTDEESEEEEVVVCKCSGRGKPESERWIPRVPILKSYVGEDIPEINNASSRVRKGKGRGRILREKTQGIRPVLGKPIEKDSMKNPLPRPKQEPIFLDSVLEVEKYVASRPSPFANRSRPEKILPTPETQTFEEEFPSLSSSHTSDCNHSGVSSPRWLSGSSVQGSVSTQDFGSLSSIFMSSSQSSRSSSFSSLYSDVTNTQNSTNSTSATASYYSDHNVTLSQPDTSCESDSDQIHYNVSNNSQVPHNINNLESQQRQKELSYIHHHDQLCSDAPENISGSKQQSKSKNWRMMEGSVVQLDGLPKGCDLYTLEELIAQYGTIKDTQILEKDTAISIRYSLTSEDACEWVVSCLDGTDCLFPDSNHVLKCFKVG